MNQRTIDNVQLALKNNMSREMLEATLRSLSSFADGLQMQFDGGRDVATNLTEIADAIKLRTITYGGR